MARFGYLPRPQNQHANWPARLVKSYPYPSYDCWVRVTSWTIDGATEGKMILAPWAVRDLAGKDSGRPALDGPGGAEDVERAVRAAGLRYDARTMPVDEARRLLSTRTPGQFFWLATDFRTWPDNKRCGSDFQGRHAVGVPATGVTAAGKIKVMNPLCPGYRWVPLEAVLRSMVQYGRDHGYGDGTVYLGALKDPKPPAPAPVVAGRCYALPSTGASLRNVPRPDGNLLAVVPFGGRLRVAGPSGAGTARPGARSPRWLAVTGLGTRSLRPRAWVLASEVTASPPSNGPES